MIEQRYTGPVIAIVGPTACGKTKRGVEVARHFHGEIVSADSRQVYRGMDVGTGKDLGDYGDVPYHLIDVAPAGYKYNLYEYLRDSRKALDEICSRGKTPIIVGGTGLYVESLLKGMVLPEVPENVDLRNSLKDKSLEELTAILSETKQLHNTTDVDTPQRAIRAIEIERYYEEHPDEAVAAHNPSPLSSLIIGIDIPREERRRLITERMRRRFDSEDMLAEVRSLIESGVDPETLIYYGLEYKYLTRHVLGLITKAEMERELEIAIHQFAKRQMTWFRGMERRGFTINWLPWDLPSDEFVGAVEKLLENVTH
ncbi:MAG: tRNA (adenosine(37)-N6)-dimethylallyltransferase MiaA [Muribaculaceae bacterium]|nr:tRNA (adenosine(37)-N6)-dimethylallyltransferase MiaA [Muribaculaceae bacterium]